MVRQLGSLEGRGIRIQQVLRPRRHGQADEGNAASPAGIISNRPAPLSKSIAVSARKRGGVSVLAETGSQSSDREGRLEEADDQVVRKQTKVGERDVVKHVPNGQWNDRSPVVVASHAE